VSGASRRAGVLAMKDSAVVRQIPITRTVFGPEEMRAVQLPLESGWVVQGPYVKQFEERFSNFTGARFSVATSSCTTALHIAVAALGLKPGDEVIVPAFTWISTANVVEFMGARPIFCDIDLQTFNIDTSQLEGLISPRTVGIIPVHLFGLCANMRPILEIAKRHGLWIVEDAACAFGAWLDGQHAGTFGEMGCFSFHPRKSITTGEGGMITTGREDLDGLSRALRDHGASRSDLARHNNKAAFLLSEYNLLGYNYRLTDIQGALGCAQMDRAEWILAERTRCARRYDTLLADVSWLTPPLVPDGYIHGYQAYVCLFHPEEPTLENVDRLHQERNDLMLRLEEEGISTRQGTHAPIILGYYAEKYGLRPEQFPNAYLADRLSLTLPLYAQMTDEEQDVVVEMLLQTQEKHT
jgi:perosamine synthetase